MAAPMIPGVNDAELENILEAASEAGAMDAHMQLLRLPLELGPLFTDWLHTHLPDRANHVLSLIRQSRAGRLNDPDFGSRFTGTGPLADLLQQRFARAARQLRLDGPQPKLDVTQFRVPKAAPSMQLSLF